MHIKRITHCLLLITLLSLLTPIMSAHALNNTNDSLLVLDMQNSSILPPKFRTTLTLPAQLNPQGFTELRLMGSGQFSLDSLKTALKQVNSTHIVIIDLRQESHGYLNGNAISWYGPHDASNAGKTDEEIETLQHQLLGQLSKSNIVEVEKIVHKSKYTAMIDKTIPIAFKVHQISSEKQLAASLGLEYYRLYVQDHHAPDENQVDRFIKIIEKIPQGSWIYLHCRGGKGRTSMFMTLYDMMRNAKQMSFDDIMARQTAIGGSNLAKLPPIGTYKYEFALERLNFLKQFYQYAAQNRDGFKTTWSQWLLLENK